MGKSNFRDKHYIIFDVVNQKLVGNKLEITLNIQKFS